MLKQFRLYIFLISSVLYSQDVTLSFSWVMDSSGVMEINIENSADVYGFQFNVTGINITGADLGNVVPGDWIISANETSVLGFSLVGTFIPAGFGDLVILNYEATDGAICIEGGVASGEGGGGLTVSYGDCLYDFGCTDVSACNYNPEAGSSCESCCQYPEDFDWCDCEGSVEDCLNECGGNAYEDDCGVCDDNPDNDNETCNTIINVPGDYSSIQEAIDNSINGDTVLVQPGVYIENLNINKDIYLTSWYYLDPDPIYIEQTLILAASSGSVININAVSPTVQGFTIANGSSDEGGGIHLAGSNSLLTDLVIKDNYATYKGGGIYAVNFSGSIINTEVFNNEQVQFTMDSGGGGIYLRYSECQLINVNVHDNSSYYGEGNGGGIYFYESNSIINSSNITSNSGGDYGGGVYINGGDPTFNNVIIDGNSCQWSGTGLYLTDSSPIIQDCKISNNNLIIDYISNPILNNIEITGVVGSNGIENYGNFSLNNSNIHHNYRGIFSEGNVNLEINNTRFYSNDIEAININNNDLNTVLNNITLYEDKINVQGGGSGTLSLNNSILWNTDGSSVIENASETTVMVSYCDISGGEDGIDGGTLYWLGDNLDVDPLFINPGNDNFQLTAESPCIDAGSPFQTDEDGSRIDMGAFPFDPDLIYGCTDPAACNFDSDATDDDGSCEYPEDFGWCDCEGNVEDCAGECGGDAVIQTYYWDEDGDGVGADETATEFCSANIEDGWVEIGGEICPGGDDLMDIDGDGMPDACDVDLMLLDGNNLGSFYVKPDDLSVESIFESLGSNITAIVGAGIFAGQFEGGWLGNLNELNIQDAWWIKLNSPASFEVQGAVVDPDMTYYLKQGWNLISFPLSGSVSLGDAIPDEIAEQIWRIVGAGTAATYIDGNWVGSLATFDGGGGYWVVANEDIDFKFDCEAFGSLICDGIDPYSYGCTDPYADNYDLDADFDNNTCEYNNPFSNNWNQSAVQMFYLFEEAQINGSPLDEGDWVGAYRDTDGDGIGDVLVGGGPYSPGEVSTVPVMGNDGVFIENYMLDGEIPVFKIYDESENQTYNAVAEVPPFDPDAIAAYIELLYVGEEDCAGNIGGDAYEDDCGVCDDNPENDNTTCDMVYILSPNGSEIFNTDNPFTVTWVGLNYENLDSYEIFYSHDNGDSWNFMIASDEIDNDTMAVQIIVPGLPIINYECKIKVNVWEGENEYEDISDNPFSVSGSTLSTGFSEGWSLFGTPLDLGENNSMVENLGSDGNFGSLGEDWYVYDQNGGYPSGPDDSEYPLNHGTGYILNLASEASLTLTGEVKEIIDPSIESADLSLNVGWNLISDPLVAIINKDRVIVHTNSSDYSWEDAVDLGFIQSSVMGWSNSGAIKYRTSQLEPWEGYWVHTSRDLDLKFSPHNHDDLGRDLRDGWFMNIFARGINDNSSGDFVSVGLSESATESFRYGEDEYDIPGPLGFKYVDLFFDRSDWLLDGLVDVNGNEIQSNDFFIDTRPYTEPDDAQLWQISAFTQNMDPSDEIEISWNQYDAISIGAEYDIYLHYNSQVYDMKQAFSVSVNNIQEAEIFVSIGSEILPGCTDEIACNYNPYATDDDGSCEYPEDFGWCDCDGNVEDCLDDCDGDAYEDDCGVCDNNPDNDNFDMDCAGECYGESLEDDCGVCDNNPDNDNESCGTALTISGVVLSDSTIVINMQNPLPVYGFQFQLTGITLLGEPGYGGSAEDNEFIVSTSESIAIGFSLTGDYILPNDTILTQLYYIDIGDSLCFNDIILSGGTGISLIPIQPDCFYVIEGCTDPIAPNFNPDATVDDGSCIYDGIAPEINYIVDFPDDQGGNVYISFNSSYYDTDTLNRDIEIYSIERWDPDPINGDSIWINITSGSAYGEDSYVYQVSTMIDSNDTGDGMTQFRVIANMDEGLWVSDPVWGYSVDNLSPASPGLLWMDYQDADQVILTWDMVLDEDLNHYSIYQIRIKRKSTHINP